MIELRHDSLQFTAPDVHEDARLSISFLRTLRIPDDGATHPLPAGLGTFPLRHVDDFAGTVPPAWIDHGGVMLPMYQSEAMWIRFSSIYPFAIKVAAGKIDAVSGEPFRPGLHRGPQDYAVSPEQPWIDGFCVERGVIRQFVAMPLGAGYSAEEQLTGAAEHGGLQLQVYPIKPEHYSRAELVLGGSTMTMSAPPDGMVMYRSRSMGLAPGGRMRQEIHADGFPLDAWDLEHGSRCFVHLVNSLDWREITGEAPPTRPFTADDYRKHRIPWFEYYDDSATPVEGSKVLRGLKSVKEMGAVKGEQPFTDGDRPVTERRIIELRRGLRPGEVREGRF